MALLGVQDCHDIGQAERGFRGALGNAFLIGPIMEHGGQMHHSLGGRARRFDGDALTVVTRATAHSRRRKPRFTPVAAS